MTAESFKEGTGHTQVPYNKTKKKNARENFDKIFKKYEERPSARFQESPNTEPTSSTASKAKSSTPSQTLKNKIKEIGTAYLQKLKVENPDKLKEYSHNAYERKKLRKKLEDEKEKE